MAQDKIPTGRVRRTARIGRVAASQAVRQAGTKVANVARSDEGAAKALEKRQVETAQQIVTALGTMKGAAMKLGQVMSFLDVGLVPEEYREEFQRKLGELRDAAPKVRFEDMQKVIEEELEEPVCRGLLRVRHRADRRRLDRPGLPGHAPRRARRRGQGPVPGRGRRGARGHAEPGADPAPHEARGAGDRRRARSPTRCASASTRSSTTSSRPRTSGRCRASTAGHPFIVVPPVVTTAVPRARAGHGVRRGHGLRGAQGACRRRTATESARSSSASTWAACTATASSPATRIPGNYKLLADGRLAFLDFGLFKRMDAPEVDLELACQRAVVEDDRREAASPARRGRLPAPPRARRSRHPHGVRPGLDLVVHAPTRRSSSRPRSPPR